MQKQAAEWTKFRNILCVRPDNLGDVLMTTPAIRALKKATQGRKITLLTSQAGQKIARLLPEIDEIIVFDFPWIKNPFGSSPAIIQSLIRKLSSKNFDAAVIFSVYSQNPLPAATLCYLAGIQKIAGYCRENPYHLITDWIPDPEPVYRIDHEVIRQLNLVAFLNVPTHDDTLSVPVIHTNAKISLLEKLKNLGINFGNNLLIVHPGVSEPKRQYPVTSFTETVRLLSKEPGTQVLITGVKEEARLAETVKGHSNAVCLAGKLNLEEFIILIKISSLLISNNTGPVHIAAAVKTPVIVLYALTNPQHTPWKVAHKVLPFRIPESLQSKNMIIRLANDKCFLNEPEMVSPAQIIAAAKALLNDVHKDVKTELLMI